MTLYSTRINVETFVPAENVFEESFWDFITKSESEEDAYSKFLAHAQQFLFPDQYDDYVVPQEYHHNFLVGGVTYRYIFSQPEETTKEDFKDQMYDQCKI